MKTALITGATGFIGHYLANEFNKDCRVVCLVRPGTHNLIRLENIKHEIQFLEHDITQPLQKLQLDQVDYILHCGGNPSSLDSLNNPRTVVEQNVLGTLNLLEVARNYNLSRFVYYSAGEVFGPIEQGTESLEDDPYNSPSPYAASKAAGEELCLAYSASFGIPVSIQHITNTFGPRSQCNRLPVIAIKKLLNRETIDIHADSEGNVGGRKWFHAEDVALQTRFILAKQKNICEKWNSTGSKFLNNIEFVQIISNHLGCNFDYQVKTSPRLGQAPFYSMSNAKLIQHGWKEPKTLEERLKETINWYMENQQWLDRE